MGRLHKWYHKMKKHRCFLTAAFVLCAVFSLYATVYASESTDDAQTVRVGYMLSAVRGDYRTIQMPIMNGYEATRAIRCHRRIPIKSIPVIAMTADAFTEDVMRCIEVGMNAHIAKPVNIRHLLKAIDGLHSELPPRFSVGGY